MFNSLQHAVSGSPWTYPVIAGVCFGDAMLPLLPAETAVITGAVLAAHGHLNIGLVLLAAIVGALIGDNCAYALGRAGLSRVVDRLLDSEKNRRRLEWGRTQLRRHGSGIIIVARFIPGGRSATTYAAGTLMMPWKRRFLPADSVAAVLWGFYSSALGYFGGTTFENNLWLPLAVATGAGLLIGLLGEVLRRMLFNRKRR